MGTRFDLGTSKAGIRAEMERTDAPRTGHLGQDWVFHHSQNVDSILEANKASQNFGDGYTKDRSAQFVASVPVNLIFKWWVEEGWWYYDLGKDPDVAKKAAAKLNSIEYRYLRASPGILSASGGYLR